MSWKINPVLWQTGYCAYVCNMDVVITFVDGSRRQWQQQYAKRVGGKPSFTRFRDWETLRYLLRGIETNAPFVRNVYLAVSDSDQVPEWVNTATVKIVTHAEFIPAQLLPTFSSNVIEMWLHAIPGLSEQFLYFNDDVFLLNRCTEGDFFVNGKPRLSPRIRTQRTTMFHEMIYNSTQQARAILGMPATPEFISQRHTVAPMTRRSFQYAYEIAGKQIFASFTPTRDAKNFNDYLFMDLNYFAGKYHPAMIDFKYFGLDAQNAPAICEHIETSRTKTLCINDGCDPADFVSVKTQILGAFEHRFPNKSIYEI